MELPDLTTVYILRFVKLFSISESFLLSLGEKCNLGHNCNQNDPKLSEAWGSSLNKGTTKGSACLGCSGFLCFQISHESFVTIVHISPL